MPCFSENHTNNNGGKYRDLYECCKKKLLMTRNEIERMNQKKGCSNNLNYINSKRQKKMNRMKGFLPQKSNTN